MGVEIFIFLTVGLLLGFLLNTRFQQSNEETYEQGYKRQQKEISEKNRKIEELEKELKSSKYSYKKEKLLLEDEISKIEKQYEKYKKSTQTRFSNLQTENKEQKKKLSTIESDYQTLISSNLTAIPWLSGMMGDFLTYEMENLAKDLDWGYDSKRLKKVASIREIRAEAARITAQGKEAIYQLEYLRSLFPNLDDYLEADYKDIFVPEDITDFDPARGYLSKEEWDTLSSTEKNQLALDRYIKSQKSKWQIGRDYELAVAHEYEQRGYKVERTGSYMQLEDHGRDLIAKRDGKTQIIQCKYWSNTKTIHEKHIFQLYGSVVSYCLENNVSPEKVKGVFVTNIKLSPFAKEVAEHLNIHVSQNHPFYEFPRIKCNINRNELGDVTYIYHLPMDAQYDRVKICNKGEFYAFTVKEAEEAGFRRTYKWHGND